MQSLYIYILYIYNCVKYGLNTLKKTVNTRVNIQLVDYSFSYLYMYKYITEQTSHLPIINELLNK